MKYTSIHKIVGVTYDNPDGTSRQQLLSEVRPDHEVKLIRNSNNSHDSNAVKVLNKKGQQLGFLPHEVAGEISSMLKQGVELKAQVDEITGGGSYNIGCNIHIEEVGQQQAHYREESPKDNLDKYCDKFFGLIDKGIKTLSDFDKKASSQASLKTYAKYHFQVGEKYFDRNGSYTVIELSTGTAKIRYNNGETEILGSDDIEIKERIHRNILSEKTPAKYNYDETDYYVGDEDEYEESEERIEDVSPFDNPVSSNDNAFDGPANEGY